MSGLLDTWIIPHVQYGGMLCFFLLFYSAKEEIIVTSIVLDSAATLFTPETPKGFCGLEHFTHPSIGIVASR